MKKSYDYIVYGASFSGILFALKYAEKGKSVLLLNKYGFPGGSITESLNCLQCRTHETENTISDRLLKKIYAGKFSTFFNSGSKTIFNPEVIKIVLQKEIEISGLDTLFHVLPFRIINQKNSLLLSLLGKEGEINVECGCLFDAGGEHYLDFLAGLERQLADASFFCFVRPDMKSFPLHPSTEYYPLEDGRFLLKINLSEYSGDFVENKAQESINHFTHEYPGIRIQLVPARSYLHYEPVSANTDSPILSAERITGRKYNNSEEILKAVELEKMLP